MTARSLLDRTGTLLGLVLVAAIFGVLVGGQFFAPANLELMARQAAIVCMAALGMTVVIACGGIDLSVGSIIALTTVVIALALRAESCAADRRGGGRGRGRGLRAGERRADHPAARRPLHRDAGDDADRPRCGEGARGRAPHRSADHVAERSAAHARADACWCPPASGRCSSSRCWSAGCSRYTRFGRHVFAIGSNERMARLCGVAIDADEDRRLHAGARRSPAWRDCSSSPSCRSAIPTVAIGLELDVIAAVIIGGGSLSGGRGTVAGTIIGAAIMTVIQIGCSQKGLANWVQQIVTGGIIVAAVTLDRVRSAMATRDEESPASTSSICRFPTSQTHAGTDAVHTDPDYSAAYVILHTDGGLEGHGFTFTIGRGNEICVDAIRAFEPLVTGRLVEDIMAAPAQFWRELADDSQLRWLGPQKGVIHISMAAIINAVWDLHAKRAGKPVWKLLADMTPREIVGVRSISSTSPMR